MGNPQPLPKNMFRKPRTDRHYALYDVKTQIQSLKEQFLFYAIFNRSQFNDDTYIKAIHSLCNRVAKFYKVKYRPSVLGKPTADDVNALIAELNDKLGLSQEPIDKEDAHVSELANQLAEVSEQTESEEVQEKLQ